MTVAKALLDVRKKNNLTQDDVASTLHVTRQAVSRWENDETMPTIDMLKTIATTYGLDAASLLGLPEPPICQSCAMPLKEVSDLGTNGDSTASFEYCTHCFAEGSFTLDCTMEEMVENNLRYLKEYNAENGTSFSEEEARGFLTAHLATLKRW
ncbi:MAG: helix-turn-helix domain-containing protein [Coriobacteriia bacterium]|nr:helix-turn-helix domain-containing protein [Coriobacteriia bacterium]